MTVYALNLQTASKWKELSAAQDTELMFRVTLKNEKKKMIFNKRKITHLGSNNHLHWATKCGRLTYQK